MLPSWRDRVFIALTPDALTLVRVARGFKPVISGKKTLPCIANENGTPWRGAMQALQNVLATQDPADATVVLSNHFVRYALVPWSDALSGADEELAFTQHCFSRVYGDAAASWDLRVSDSKPGTPRVASAVDRQLIESLRNAFRQSRLRLRSVQPFLMTCFNRWRRSFGSQDGWFVVAERGRYCCAVIEKQQWRSVRSGKLGDDFLQELPQLLKRELVLTGAGANIRTVRAHIPDQPKFALTPANGWRFTSLVLPPRAGFSPFNDTPYAMAMSAVA